MGYEVAGTVAAVGPGVSGVETGRRVLAATRFNGFAERAVADMRNVLPLPDGMSFEQGASVPVVYGTAYAAIELMASVRAGETVLVQAAAGGVGIAALQLLRARGAEVIGTASASKHDACREHGASHTIDYRTQDVKQAVDRITGGQGVDVVLDSLGEFRAQLLDAAPRRAAGRPTAPRNIVTGDRRNIVKAIREVATMPRFNALKLMNENKAVMGLNLLHWWDERGSLEELIDPLVSLMERGVVDPVVAATFPVRPRRRRPPLHPGAQERRQGRADPDSGLL